MQLHSFLSALAQCLRDGAKSSYAVGSGILSIVGAAKDFAGISIPLSSGLIWGAASILIFVAYFKAVWMLHRERERRVGPDMILLPPKHTYSVIWDAPKSLQIITRPNLAANESEPLGTRFPVFRIKNVGHAVAKSIQVRWTIDEHFSLDVVTANSRRMKKFGFTVSSNRTRSEQKQAGGTVAILSIQSHSGTSSLPYLVPQLDQESFEWIEMPAAVYEACEIYFAAQLPDDRPYQKLELGCTAEISCKEPVFYTPQRFKIRIFGRDDGSQMPGEDQIPEAVKQQFGLLPKPVLKATVTFRVSPE